MSFENPYENGIIWIFPLFIWIYITYHIHDFFSYSYLTVGIIVIGLKVVTDIILKLNMKTKKINSLFDISLSKYLIDLIIAIYWIFSVWAIYQFKSDFLAYSIFWLSIAGIVANIMTTVTFFLPAILEVVNIVNRIVQYIGIGKKVENYIKNDYLPNVAKETKNIEKEKT